MMRAQSTQPRARWRSTIEFFPFFFARRSIRLQSPICASRKRRRLDRHVSARSLVVRSGENTFARSLDTSTHRASQIPTSRLSRFTMRINYATARHRNRHRERIANLFHAERAFGYACRIPFIPFIPEIAFVTQRSLIARINIGARGLTFIRDVVAARQTTAQCFDYRSLAPTARCSWVTSLTPTWASRYGVNRKSIIATRRDK